MPNWCQNILIYHPYPKSKRSLKDILRHGKVDVVNDEPDSQEVDNVISRDGFFSFNKVIPVKDDRNGFGRIISQTDAWGTKWDMFVPISYVDLNKNTISFETAWEPPLRVIEVLSKKSKSKLSVVYVEHGMNFCGFDTYDKGVLINSGSGEIDKFLATDTEELAVNTIKLRQELFVDVTDEYASLLLDPLVSLILNESY